MESPIPVPLPAPHHDLALSIGGMDCVAQQIHEDMIESLRVAEKLRQLAVVTLYHCHVLHLGIGIAQGAFQTLVDVREFQF